MLEDRQRSEGQSRLSGRKAVRYEKCRQDAANRIGQTVALRDEQRRQKRFFATTLPASRTRRRRFTTNRRSPRRQEEPQLEIFRVKRRGVIYRSVDNECVVLASTRQDVVSLRGRSRPRDWLMQRRRNSRVRFRAEQGASGGGQARSASASKTACTLRLTDSPRGVVVDQHAIARICRG